MREKGTALPETSSIVERLLLRNREQSQAFVRSGLQRKKYRAEHKTEIAALKCMDGRLLLPYMTNTPVGIIQPFRNIGGSFDLGWPFFGKLMGEWVDYSVSQGRNCLVLVTYHFSKGSRHRGCKGHGYNTEAAREASQKLLRQFEAAFGDSHDPVYPILVGIETDEESLIFHGKNGGVLDLAKENTESPEQLRRLLERLYPDMKPYVVADLLPLVVGNALHVQEVRKTHRPVHDLDHKEQVLAVGRGFDWLHWPNKALIVGPYSSNLADPIAKAAGILADNIASGRVSEKEGLVLMTSAVYRQSTGSERFLALEKAKFLADFALTTIQTEQPGLLKYLKIVAGIVNVHDRLFEEVPLEERFLSKSAAA